MIKDCIKFMDAVRQHRLLDEAQLDEAVRVLQPQCPNLEALTTELHRCGWLTLFQTDQIRRGKASQLVLGQYLLLEVLGAGGMGQVYKARHRLMDRIVALKVIRKECLADPITVRRFRREVQAVGQLAHPNIITAHDADQVGETFFFVMEYVEGIDLHQLVQTHGQLPIAEACEYVRQAALGLQHAHERGLVHRDIKPSNLLVARRGGSTELAADADPLAGLVVKILDMGLARLNQPGEPASVNATLTRQEVVMGTPDYMAPEQARNSHTVDIRADLYSLGCSLYFLLAGREPFPAATTTEKLYKQWCEEADPLEQLRSDVPADLLAVVRKLMAKPAEQRYQTPAELVTALTPLCRCEGLVPLAVKALRERYAAPGQDLATTRYPMPAEADASSRATRRMSCTGLLPGNSEAPAAAAPVSEDDSAPWVADGRLQPTFLPNVPPLPPSLPEAPPLVSQPVVAETAASSLPTEPFRERYTFDPLVRGPRPEERTTTLTRPQSHFLQQLVLLVGLVLLVLAAVYYLFSGSSGHHTPPTHKAAPVEQPYHVDPIPADPN